MVKFEGATMTLDDDGNRVYSPRGPIWINPAMVAGVYDHTILVGVHKVRVMEELPVIVARLSGR